MFYKTNKNQVLINQ